MQKWEDKPGNDIVEYLLLFERTVKQANVSQRDWCLELQPLLGDVFVQICAQLSESEIQDYDV